MITYRCLLIIIIRLIIIILIIDNFCIALFSGVSELLSRVACLHSDFVEVKLYGWLHDHLQVFVDQNYCRGWRVYAVISLR